MKQFGPVKSDKETTKHTTRVGLPRFPADSKFLQVVARMATALAEPGATALASPENPLELEMHSSQSEVPVTQQFDPIKSDEGIARHIRRVGLSKFPAGCEFLQAVGRKAAESGTTALASLEHLPGLEAHSSQAEAPAAQQLDPLNFDQDITGTITSEGLGDSLPAGNEFPQIVAHEATTLAESGTAALASPEHFPGLEVHFSQPEVPAAEQLDPVIFDNEITGNITGEGLGERFPADKTAESGTTALTSLGHFPGLEAHSSQSEVPVAQQLDPEITGVTSEELGECFPADNGFLQTVVQEAAESGTTALASPEQLPELEAHSLQTEVHAAQQLDPVEPDSEITRHITNAGPSDNFPAGSELPQIVVHEATTLAESGTAAVASPENLPGLEAQSSQPEAAAAQQLDPEITGITSEELGECFPTDNGFPQTVVQEAAESGTTALASPEQLPELEAHSSQTEVHAAQQLDPVEPDSEIMRHITNAGPSDNFPAGSELPQIVAHEATTLAESGTAAVASPENLPGLEAQSSQPEAAAAQQLDPEITGNITSNGLGESSPAEGEFLQAVAGKAAESETTTVASPEHFAGLEAHSSQPEAPVAQQFDPATFDKEITGYITSEGLGEFFPAGSEFLQTVARKAAILAESEATTLASPEYLPELTRLSLYQHILFCGVYSGAVSWFLGIDLGI